MRVIKGNVGVRCVSLSTGAAVKSIMCVAMGLMIVFAMACAIFMNPVKALERYSMKTLYEYDGEIGTRFIDDRAVSFAYSEDGSYYIYDVGLGKIFYMSKDDKVISSFEDIQKKGMTEEAPAWMATDAAGELYLLSNGDISQHNIGEPMSFVMTKYSKDGVVLAEFPVSLMNAGNEVSFYVDDSGIIQFAYTISEFEAMYVALSSEGEVIRSGVFSLEMVDEGYCNWGEWGLCAGVYYDGWYVYSLCGVWDLGLDLEGCRIIKQDPRGAMATVVFDIYPTMGSGASVNIGAAYLDRNGGMIHVFVEESVCGRFECEEVYYINSYNSDGSLAQSTPTVVPLTRERRIMKGTRLQNMFFSPVTRSWRYLCGKSNVCSMKAGSGDVRTVHYITNDPNAYRGVMRLESESDKLYLLDMPELLNLLRGGMGEEMDRSESRDYIRVYDNATGRHIRAVELPRLFTGQRVVGMAVDPVSEDVTLVVDYNSCESFSCTRGAEVVKLSRDGEIVDQWSLLVDGRDYLHSTINLVSGKIYHQGTINHDTEFYDPGDRCVVWSTTLKGENETCLLWADAVQGLAIELPESFGDGYNGVLTNFEPNVSEIIEMPGGKLATSVGAVFWDEMRFLGLINSIPVVIDVSAATADRTVTPKVFAGEWCDFFTKCRITAFERPLHEGRPILLGQFNVESGDKAECRGGQNLLRGLDLMRCLYEVNAPAIEAKFDGSYIDFALPPFGGEMLQGENMDMATERGGARDDMVRPQGEESYMGMYDAATFAVSNRCYIFGYNGEAIERFIDKGDPRCFPGVDTNTGAPSVGVAINGLGSTWRRLVAWVACLVSFVATFIIRRAIRNSGINLK